GARARPAVPRLRRAGAAGPAGHGTGHARAGHARRADARQAGHRGPGADRRGGARLRPTPGRTPVSPYSSLWSMWSVTVVSATGRLVLTMKPSTSSSRNVGTSGALSARQWW